MREVQACQALLARNRQAAVSHALEAYGLHISCEDHVSLLDETDVIGLKTKIGLVVIDNVKLFNASEHTIFDCTAFSDGIQTCNKTEISKYNALVQGIKP